MGIKGLTDTVASFPCIGTLRKGAKKTQENAPGKDLSYFRFTSDDPAAEKMFTDAYGAEPREINVYLPFPTTDENASFWFEHWVAGGLKWRGDGETLVMWQDEKGEYQHTPKPQPENEGKPTGRLMVIIPELQRLAYVTVQTTSWHDCRELSANLRAAEVTANQMGKDLMGIPFKLTRVGREISTPSGKGGKRARREKWLLHLEVGPTWFRKQLAESQRLALEFTQETEKTLSLPAPDWDDEDDRIIDGSTGEILTIEAPPEPEKPKPASKKKPEPEPEPEPANEPSKPKRPYTPDVLIAEFRRRIVAAGGHVPLLKGEDELASIEQKGLLVGKLNEVFAPADKETIEQNRHCLIEAVTGDKSTKTIGRAAAGVLLSWMLAEPDDTGDRPIKQFVVQEAQAIVRAHLEASGQQTLL